jgi:hypothetical protein
MADYKTGVQAFALVRMLDSSGVPVTGLAFGAITATLLYSDGTTASITPASGADWVEATTGAFSGTGVYRLKITAGNMTVNGQWGIAVSAAGADTAVVAWGDIVANLESDTYTRIGAPVGASVSADILELDKDIYETQALLETRYGHHTYQKSTGQFFYVSPNLGNDVSGTGSRLLPYATVTKALSMITGGHSVIRLVADAGLGGPTTLTEQVTVNKRYVFIRGPGRDFIWTRAAGAAGPTINVTATGCALSGFQCNNPVAGATSAGITVTNVDFTEIKRVWFTSIVGDNGVVLLGGSQSEIHESFFLGLAGIGVNVYGTTAVPCNYNRIYENDFTSNVGDGIRISTLNLPADASNTILKRNSVVNSTAGWGINVVSGLNTVVEHNAISGNAAGQFSDTGTSTDYIAGDPWDDPISGHVLAGTTGFTLNSLPNLLSNIVATGAAVNQTAEAFTLTTGTQIGTYTNTFARNAVYHQLNDTAGTLDGYYRFDVGGDGVPTGITYYGRINSNNDFCNFWGWNFATAAWAQLGTVAGINTGVNSAAGFSLFTSMVSTPGLATGPAGGVVPGKVFIRLQGTGLSTSNNFVDQIYVSYAIITRTVGYADGAVWLDTVNGTAGSVNYVNGTADYPCLLLSDALLLCTQMKMRHIEVINGSTLTLTGPLTNYTFSGETWILALGSQVLTHCMFGGAEVSGTCTGTDIHFKDCHINVVTVPPCHFVHCYFKNVVTFGASGDYHMFQCSTMGTGGLTLNVATFEFNSLANLFVSIRAWSGATKFKHVVATDEIHWNGWGTITLDTTCTGGLIVISGNSNLVDQSGGGAGGALTIYDSARWSEDQNITNITGKILGGGVGVITGTGAWVLDNAGAAVAPASTALSNVVWTNAKAAFVDVAITSRSSHTAADIWDVALAGHLGAGSTGLALNTASVGGNPATIASAVWDELLAGHVIAGSAGTYLHAAGSAGDPWSTIVPGAYGAGTAGNILGNFGGTSDWNSWPIQKYLKK